MSNAIDAVIDEFMYPLEVRERNGLFYVICKTFNIIEADTSIDNAYSKVVLKRHKISEELASFGVDITAVKQNTDASARTTNLEKWMQVSVIFMCLCVPICILICTLLLASKASVMMATAKNNIKHQVNSVINNPGQLTTLLNNVAEKLDSATPERREEIKLTLRRIVKFMKPYKEELHELTNLS